MYQYNYLNDNLWIKDIQLNCDKNLHLDPYFLTKFVKDEYKKINNNKYFFLLDFSSIFITFKLNNILLTNYHCNKKVEYCHFLIVYLLKYISFENSNDFSIIQTVLNKILFFIKPKKCYYFNEKKQSYNFCKYSYKCKSFYNNKSCKFDHTCYNKICIDIENLNKNINNLSKNNIKKYIVTIHFVIEHIYNENFMYKYLNDINM